MRRGLALAVAAASLALLLVVIPAPVWLRAVVDAPLVVFLPGYALAALLLPPGSIRPSERAIYSVAFSIALASLGATVLQLVVDLNRTTWTILLAAATIGLASARLLKGVPPTAGRRAGIAAPALTSIGLLAAVALAGLAVHSASLGVSKAEDETEFTEFWLLPSALRTPTEARRLTVGVRSHEQSRVDYTLRLAQGGRLLAVRRLELPPGASWKRTLEPPGASAALPIVASLRRDGAPYRQLHVLTQR